MMFINLNISGKMTMYTSETFISDFQFVNYCQLVYMLLIFNTVSSMCMCKSTGLTPHLRKIL